MSAPSRSVGGYRELYRCATPTLRSRWCCVRGPRGCRKKKKRHKHTLWHRRGWLGRTRPFAEPRCKRSVEGIDREPRDTDVPLIWPGRTTNQARKKYVHVDASSSLGVKTTRWPSAPSLDLHGLRRQQQTKTVTHEGTRVSAAHPQTPAFLCWR